MRVGRAGRLVLVITGAVGVTALAPDPVQEFLRRHWRAPIPRQGAAPESFTPVEASLHPEACGTCHPAQLADWKTSLHAASMGPGVSGQLVEMIHTDPGAAVSCDACHAPLAEQASHILTADGIRANPALDGPLRERGIPCAACHVRAHERFGPPRRDGSLTSGAPRSALPHHGVTRTPAFLRSEFCRGCHQFETGGFALNGKLLEDTYNEWRASRFARGGVQCQDCHMPDRRHLWRGIHDPEMVRSGLTITAVAGAARYRPGQVAAATLRVENTRVGHAFPTYVTPQVVLRGELVDGAGVTVPGTTQEKVIGREVALDLSREVSDTRLRPGERAEFRYRHRVDAPGLAVRLSVIVYPDAFYTRFFETLLAQGAGRGEAQIREALAATRRSPFTVFTRDLPVT